jgi:DNA polymerase-3 subunit delta'
METIVQLAIQFNQAVLRRFAVLKEKGRLAHAYLFIGPPDIGKGETALAVAKLMNCEAPREEVFCDACPPCRKISSGNHPDVFVVDNGHGEPIKIEQVRELLGRDRLKPFMASRKVFVICNIENLTVEGANAFLKTLEEPSAGSLLLLTTSAPEKNLDTIRSRCQAVYIPAVLSHNLAGELRQEYDMDAESSHFLAYFAQGCPGTARRLKENRFLEQKDVFIDGFILNRPRETSVKEMLADKVRTKEFLNILLSWLRDAFLVKAGVGDGRLVHLDRLADLKRFQKRYVLKDLDKLNAAVVNMCQLLADNLNIKLPLLIIGEQLWEK